MPLSIAQSINWWCTKPSRNQEHQSAETDSKADLPCHLWIVHQQCTPTNFRFIMQNQNKVWLHTALPMFELNMNLHNSSAMWWGNFKEQNLLSQYWKCKRLECFVKSKLYNVCTWHSILRVCIHERLLLQAAVSNTIAAQICCRIFQSRSYRTALHWLPFYFYQNVRFFH